MNRLNHERVVNILHLLVEGNSIRGTSRLTGASPVTVLRYLAIAGRACAAFHDANVRNVKAKRVQCDEIWSFVHAKDRNATKEMKAAGKAGSVWTWTAIDCESKLIVSYLIGGRDADYALEFMQDVADRVVGKIQLTTDGHSAYFDAVETAFGVAKVDYAQLVKVYGESGEKGPERKYSPGICIGAKKVKRIGHPDKRHVSTSYVEKHNQTMRQHMKRFARLTAAHSKKVVNHLHMVSLYTVWYNYVRINSAVRMSPAMAANISDHLWEMDDLTRLVEEREALEASRQEWA